MKEDNIIKLSIAGLLVLLFIAYRKGKNSTGKVEANVDTDFLDPSVDFKSIAKRANNALSSFGGDAGEKGRVIEMLFHLNDNELGNVYNIYQKDFKSSLLADIKGETWIWTWGTNYNALISRFEALNLI